MHTETESLENLENLDGFQNLINIYKASGSSGIFGATLSQNSKLNNVCGLKNLYDANQGNYYLEGFGNGTILPEGEANTLLDMCEWFFAEEIMHSWKRWCYAFPF